MSELVTPELLTAVLDSTKGKEWLSLLEREAERAGEDNPQGAARSRLEERLGDVLGRLGQHYENVKLGALDAVEQLQRSTNAFFEEALTSKTAPDLPRLQKLLGDMDEALADLEKNVGDVAGDPEAVQPAAPKPTSDTPPATTTPLAEPPRAASKPPGEPPVMKPGEPLGKRYKLTKEQRAYFNEWKKRAGDNEAELEKMRYERNQVVRRNRGDAPISEEAYAKLVRDRATKANREGGTAEAKQLRSAVSDFVGRTLESGDTKPRKPKTFTVEIDGEPVTTRPDGVTLKPDGTLDDKPVLQEHKYWRDGEDGDVIEDTDQTRAQRKIALDHDGKHVLSISADHPELDAIPPRPRPDAALGSSRSEIVFVDRVTKKVTHVWSGEKKIWVPYGR